ncbi:unnamed protein product, partial [Bodo saltans]
HQTFPLVVWVGRTRVLDFSECSYRNSPPPYRVTAFSPSYRSYDFYQNIVLYRGLVCLQSHARRASLLTEPTRREAANRSRSSSARSELKNCTSVTNIVIAGDNVTIMIQGGSAIPIISVAADPRTIRNTSVLLMDVSCSGETCSSTVPWFSSSSSSAFIGLNITAQNVTAHMEKVDKGVAGLIHIYSHRLQNITLVVRNCNIRTNTTPIVVISSEIAANVSVNFLDSHIEQQSTVNLTAQYGFIYLACFDECAQLHTAISRANLTVRRSVYAVNTTTSNSLRDVTRASWRLLWISVRRGSAVAGSINVEVYDSVISSEFVATNKKLPVNVKFVILLLELGEYDKGSQLGSVPVTIVTDIRRSLFCSSGNELLLIYVDVDDVFTRAVHLTAKVSDSTLTLVSDVTKSEQPVAFQRSLTPIFVGTLSMHSDAILLVSNVQATWKIEASQAAVAISDATTVLGAAVCFAPK